MPTVLRTLLASVAFLLMGVESPRAAEFRYEPFVIPGRPFSNPRHRTLVIDGEIFPGDFRKFVQLIDDDPAQFIRISGVLVRSGGGHVPDTLRIAEVLRKTYKHVTVHEKFGPCASACFFLIVAATSRELDDGQIGLHRPYLSREVVERSSLAELEQVQKQMYDETRRWLQQNDVADRLIDTMLSRASTEVYWLTSADKAAIGRRARWYEQVLVTRCNLNKVLEERYLSGDSNGAEADAARTHVHQVIECEGHLRGREDFQYVADLLGKTVLGTPPSRRRTSGAAKK